MLRCYHIHALRRISSASGCCLRAPPAKSQAPASPLSPCRTLTSFFSRSYLPGISGKPGGLQHREASGGHLRCLATGSTLPPPPLRAAGQRRTSPAQRCRSPRVPPCCSLADYQVHLRATTLQSLVASEAGLWARPFRVPVPHQGGEERRESTRSDDARLSVANGDGVVEGQPSTSDPFPSCTRA